MEDPRNGKTLLDCQKRLKDAELPSTEFIKRRFAAFYQADKETGFYTRPYVAIAHASLMLSLGAPEAGLSRLYDWIERYEKDNSLDSPNIAALGKANGYKVWYAIRARSILFTYMDKWLTKLDARAPPVGRARSRRETPVAVLLRTVAAGPFRRAPVL